MSVNIDLGTFTFDSAAVEKSLESVKKKMFDLKNAQQEYREESKELNDTMKRTKEAQELVAKTAGVQSKAYKDLEKEVATLGKKKEELFNKELKTRDQVSKVNKEYRETEKILSSLTDAEGKRISTGEAATNAMQRNVRSINEARASNKELLAIRNELDLSTEGGIVAMEQLNDKLNANNQFIKENVSGYEQQKINIGDYEGAMRSSLGPLGDTVMLFSELSEQSEKAGGATQLASKGLKQAQTAMVGFTKSTIAFLATPIGVVIAVLAGAFLLVRNALSRSEESTNKLSKAFAPLSGIFSKVLSVLEPLGEFLINGLVKGMELAEKSFYGLMDAATATLGFLGFDDAAQGINNFKNEIKETSQAAKQLAQAEAALEAAQRKQRITQLEFQKEAELFRQIRDDESKTITERIQANDDLAKVLEKQLDAELRLAKTALTVANLRIEQEGRTKESLDAQAAALTQIADIEERITGQRSEQLANENSLRRDGLALMKERQDKLIAANEQELAFYIAQQGFVEKSAEDQLKVAKKVSEEEKKILDQKLKFKKITEIEYQTELLNIQNEYLELQRDLVIQNAELEREALLASIERRKTDYQDFTQEKLDFEIQNSQDMLTEQLNFAALQLEQGVISEQEYQNNLATIKDEARTREEEARLIFDQADKDRKLIDAENQFAIDELDFNNRFAVKAARLEQQRQQELEAAKQSGADVTKINEYYAKQQLAIEQEKATAKAQMAADTLGAISSILGEESAAGKAIALAQAFINTYQGITAGVALGFPAAIPAVAAATATGFGAIKNIIKTKAAKGYVSDRKGTLLRGARHSGGGIMIEAEDGEPILTRKAYQMFPELISQINVAGGGIPLAARGMVAGNAASNNAMVQKGLMGGLDMSSLSDTISDSVRLGAKEGSLLGSSQGSQEGLIGLSDNRQIQNQSAF